MLALPRALDSIAFCDGFDLSLALVESELPLAFEEWFLVCPAMLSPSSRAGATARAVPVGFDELDRLRWSAMASQKYSLRPPFCGANTEFGVVATGPFRKYPRGDPTKPPWVVSKAGALTICGTFGGGDAEDIDSPGGGDCRLRRKDRPVGFAGWEDGLLGVALDRRRFIKRRSESVLPTGSIGGITCVKKSILGGRFENVVALAPSDDGKSSSLSRVTGR